MLFLGTFFYVSLLMLNAVAILNEERFLARIGWTYSSLQPRDVNTGFQQPYDQNGYGVAPGNGMKARIIDLIRAVRALRIPLIVFNTVIILYELALG
ncbi:ER-to-golgi transport membrane protein [Crepidotus variabilis]|uniref:ER-to-golgi transport membrane protein n=1 Tax=Crepidotus variabilis TaxID=179855 RepID=A0A9P6ESA3_9AGAR|nr:ER-to-golgi transport membrane protein [Crepidotus variabilis]